jgi:hypothetical protein
MRNKKTNIVLCILVFVLIAWMVKGTFTQPGIDKLKSDFKEVGRYRNENNTGPIQYVFSVSVRDTISKEMITYGNFQPHHKGGNTKVYFFLEGSNVPKNLTSGNVNFDPEFNKSCIALYEKSPVGIVSLKKDPFR